MMLAILIFMGAALSIAAYLVLSSMRLSREEERELAAAREREEQARREAERARRTRARWEAKIAADTAEFVVQRIAAASDPRGLGDGLGCDEGPPVRIRTGRFRRSDVPAPFSR